MTLDRVPAGARLFIDSTVFIYHFTGASDACRRCLERAEQREIVGLTSAVVASEVAHRLMMLEAVSRGLVTPGNVARKLREHPEVVRGLRLYEEQVERIPLMGVEVLPVQLGDLLRSRELRARHGLLTNDSLVLQGALSSRADGIASADRDLERAGLLPVFGPGDLPH